MRKKARISLILVLIVVVAAAGAWYFFFRTAKNKDTSNNNTNQVEDLGYDSVLDTGDLSQIDPTAAIDELDTVVTDYAQPEVTLEINLK